MAALVRFFTPQVNPFPFPKLDTGAFGKHSRAALAERHVLRGLSCLGFVVAVAMAVGELAHIRRMNENDGVRLQTTMYVENTLVAKSML